MLERSALEVIFVFGLADFFVLGSFLKDKETKKQAIIEKENWTKI